MCMRARSLFLLLPFLPFYPRPLHGRFGFHSFAQHEGKNGLQKIFYSSTSKKVHTAPCRNFFVFRYCPLPHPTFFPCMQSNGWCVVQFAFSHCQRGQSACVFLRTPRDAPLKLFYIFVACMACKRMRESAREKAESGWYAALIHRSGE